MPEAVVGHKSGTAMQASILCSFRPQQLCSAYTPGLEAKERSGLDHLNLQVWGLGITIHHPVIVQIGQHHILVASQSGYMECKLHCDATIKPSYIADCSGFRV